MAGPRPEGPGRSDLDHEVQHRSGSPGGRQLQFPGHVPDHEGRQGGGDREPQARPGAGSGESQGAGAAEGAPVGVATRSRTTYYYILCALSGCLWAGVAWLIGHKEFGWYLWGGLVASPLIGLIVGLIYRPAYKLSTSKGVWLSLVTLYVALTLFGLAIALFDLAFGNPVRG